MSYVGNTPTQQAFVAAVDYFSGNASTTAFTLSRPVASVAQVQAVISNVPQEPGVAFTVSGSTITFTSAPPSGSNNIYVYYTSPITQVIAPSPLTVTQSTVASGVAGTGPAFNIYLNGNQSVTAGVWTKVQLNTEVFDTASCFDSTTNYRFQPQIAGYYQINAQIQWLMTSGVAVVGIYKNGSVNAIGSYIEVLGNNPGSHASTVLYLNGSTDYAELYGVYVTAVSANYNGSIAQSAQTYLSGALVRAA